MEAALLWGKHLWEEQKILIDLLRQFLWFPKAIMDYDSESLVRRWKYLIRTVPNGEADKEVGEDFFHDCSGVKVLSSSPLKSEKPLS